MGVIMELEDGSSFNMEIGFLDSIVEIKKKLESITGIPASHQILSMEDDKPLDDDGEADFIFHNTRIKLRVKESTFQRLPDPDPAPEPEPVPKPKPEPVPEPVWKTPIVHFVLNFKLANSLLSLRVNRNVSVLTLKQKLCDIQKLPIDRLGLFVNGNELKNSKDLNEYAISEGSTIDVFIKPPLPQSNSSGSKKLMIWVLTRCKTKLCLKVNPMDKVGVVKGKLSKLQKSRKFELSPDGYFLIHKQHVLDERKSFLWNGVSSGDILEPFPGEVTYED